MRGLACRAIESRTAECGEQVLRARQVLQARRCVESAWPTDRVLSGAPAFARHQEPNTCMKRRAIRRRDVRQRERRTIEDILKYLIGQRRHRTLRAARIRAGADGAKKCE